MFDRRKALLKKLGSTDELDRNLAVQDLADLQRPLTAPLSAALLATLDKMFDVERLAPAASKLVLLHLEMQPADDTAELRERAMNGKLRGIRLAAQAKEPNFYPKPGKRRSAEVDAYLAVKKAAFAELLTYGHAAVPHIIDAIHADAGGYEPCQWIRALGELKAIGAAPFLQKWLSSTTWSQQKVAAAEALGRIGDIQSLPSLISALVAETEKPHTLFNVGGSLEAAIKAIAPHDAERLIEEAKGAGEATRNAAKDAAAAKFASVRDSVRGVPMDQLIDRMRRLCSQWADGASNEVLNLEARAIGEELNDRGGMAMMRTAHAALGGIRGARSLDMHWNGIGQWMG